jgi:hypothetical protein
VDLLRRVERGPDAFEQPFHSLDDVICKLDARTPKLKVELTRKRRDKFRDLYKRLRRR